MGLINIILEQSTPQNATEARSQGWMLSIDKAKVAGDCQDSQVRKLSIGNKVYYKCTSSVVKKTTTTPTPPPTGGDKQGGGNQQLPSTPFTTKQEGDVFRAWVNKTYPNYAKSIDLSPSGEFNNSHNNSHIRKAYVKYGNQYQQSQNNNGSPEKTPDEYEVIFNKYNKRTFFYSTNNEKMNITYPEISSSIQYFKDSGFNDASSYIGGVLKKFGNLIIRYETDDSIQNEVDTQLEDLKNYLKESIQIKRIIGLGQILEQISTRVKVNVVDRIPERQTEADNYRNMSSIGIRTIVDGGNELRMGDRSDTISSLKLEMKYPKDQTPLFTEDFKNFLINYQNTKNLAFNNGNITKELICSIERYKNYCQSNSSTKTTATPNTSKTPEEINFGYLTDYANAIGNGIPSYENCKKLFDYYAKQSLEFIRLKKVGKVPKDITIEKLEPIKEKIMYCQKSSNLVDRAKLDTLISSRFRIQQDKDSPYYLDI